eukprot:Blabericola_migrator_1__1104@NODE_1281_length_4905_cov_291_882389_g865_i0_p3_GENE_NODE_1281_length_4905_cov_291_882389_g865_i0NODE_1281_length_4905_cov_291_882389_g865_i0_p3_ORF_typecomplete_len173_score39_81Pkinase/PF00069_25/6_7e28Pkinase_Tyr/PF07714_17/1_3e17DUF3636/PF12331_8/0_23_NODE_1281_length_4905_cov_291_882389_g865_i035144032
MHRVVKKIWNKMSSKSDEAQMMAPVKYAPENLQFVRTVGTGKPLFLSMISSSILTGSFGRVFVTKVKGSDEIVAVKRLTKQALLKQKQEEHVLAEKAILAALDHPFCVKLLHTYKDPYYLYIVLEFVQGGEFFTYLRKTKRVSVDAARFYAAQITSIFEYLHSGDIIYRWGV